MARVPSEVGTDLDPARIEHDTALGTQALTWKRLSELDSNDTAATVSAGDLTPDASELGWSVWSGLLGVGLVNVSDLLPKVERGLFLTLYAVNLDKRGLMSRHVLISRVVDDFALHVKSTNEKRNEEEEKNRTTTSVTFIPQAKCRNSLKRERDSERERFSMGTTKADCNNLRRFLRP